MMMRFVATTLYLAQCLTITAATRNLAFQATWLPDLSIVPSSKSKALENELLAAIQEPDRLSNSDEIDALTLKLEQSGTSIDKPAISSQILGRWRLVHSTNAETSSPIQRKAFSTTSVPIYQDIFLRDVETKENIPTSSKNNDDNASFMSFLSPKEEKPLELVVSQVVKFGPEFELRVDALGSSSKYPLAELTSRQTTGKILGLNVLGVSLVGDEAEVRDPDGRIDFVFDEGVFDLKSQNLQLPYPVPFRNPLFRDWVKGWIDITYLSDRVRISRGNKGTTFVLVKEEEEERN